MAKFMFSLRDETFQRVSAEAKSRGVTIQELLRAVVLPEWVRNNLRPTTRSDSAVGGASDNAARSTHAEQREQMLKITVGRLKT